MRDKRKAAAAVLQTTVGNMTRNYLATAGKREQENTAGPVAHSFGILWEFHGRVLASEHGTPRLLIRLEEHAFHGRRLPGWMVDWRLFSQSPGSRPRLVWVRGRGCPCYLAGLASEREAGCRSDACVE